MSATCIGYSVEPIAQVQQQQRVPLMVCKLIEERDDSETFSQHLGQV